MENARVIHDNVAIGNKKARSDSREFFLGPIGQLINDNRNYY